jgi:hypothetical protein
MFHRTIIDVSKRDTLIISEDGTPLASIDNRHSISYGCYKVYKQNNKRDLHVCVFRNGLIIRNAYPNECDFMMFDSSKMSMNEVVDSIIGLIAAHDVHDS